MSLGGKHLFGSIDDTRVTFVEKKVSADRARFLKDLLEHNGFEVLLQEEKPAAEGEDPPVTVAVTDMVFNPTIWVYQRRLRTFDGRKVTPDYWHQRSDDTPPQYWKSGK